MAFLSELFYNGKINYGVITVARSVLSAILSKQGSATFGKDSNVTQTLIRGISKLRPSLTKHVIVVNLWP